MLVVLDELLVSIGAWRSGRRLGRRRGTVNLRMRVLLLVPAVALELACCTRASSGHAPEPAPTPEQASNAYGDLLAHEVMRDASADAEADAALRERGVRAFEQKQFDEARQAFSELLDRHPEDETLAQWHRMATAMTSMTSDGPGDDARWRIGIPECDTFLAKYVRCIDNMPEANRAPTLDALGQSVDAWKEAARTMDPKALVDTCHAMTDLTKKATEPFGCTW
jgi:hypothetical protein